MNSTGRSERDEGHADATSVETELWAAFEKIRSLSRGGKPVRMSYAAVADEAGRSRTLIGFDGCRYDNVRQAITKEIDARKSLRNRKNSRFSPVPHDAPMVEARVAESAPKREPTLAEIVEELREENRCLRNKIKAAAIKIVSIDDENQQLRALVATLRSRSQTRRPDGGHS